MFTGLIQDGGTIERLSPGPMTEVWVGSAFPADLVLGESIACDGWCLTVVEARGSSFRVQASPETLLRTTLGAWKPGTRVNLERALRMGDRLGGHRENRPDQKPEGPDEVLRLFRLRSDAWHGSHR